MRSVSEHAGRGRSLLIALTLLAGTLAVQAQEAMRIVPLVRDDRVLVTFELADGFSDQVRAAILSGLKTTFTYTVELRVRVPMWVDRIVDSTVVTTTVQYDSLTKRHLISRSLDGRGDEAKVTEDEAIVREWLTQFDRLPLFKTNRLEANREYYVVVRAAARPSSNVPFWPWGTSVSGMTKFTFIP